MIGLKRGTVKLYDHQQQWDIEANKAILKLREILKDVIKDIQHIGSTSIKVIKAKPIIDIAIAVDDFEEILSYREELQNNGFYYIEKSNIENQLLFACGNYYDKTGDLQTHFIHIVKTDSIDWINYINFRDYLNENLNIAKEYENLKIELAEKYINDVDRKRYLQGKHEFIVNILRKSTTNLRIYK